MMGFELSRTSIRKDGRRADGTGRCRPMLPEVTEVISVDTARTMMELLQAVT